MKKNILVFLTVILAFNCGSSQQTIRRNPNAKVVNKVFPGGQKYFVLYSLPGYFPNDVPYYNKGKVEKLYVFDERDMDLIQSTTTEPKKIYEYFKKIAEKNKWFISELAESSGTQSTQSTQSTQTQTKPNSQVTPPQIPENLSRSQLNQLKNSARSKPQVRPGVKSASTGPGTEIPILYRGQRIESYRVEILEEQVFTFNNAVYNASVRILRVKNSTLFTIIQSVRKN